MKTLLLAFLALILLPLAGHAAEPAPPAPDRAASIAKAEAYLKGLTTAKARFLQTAPDGSQLIGTFYLARPGKLRFEYDLPVKDFIVADGVFIYFYDADMKEQTNAPIGQTLADFLLRPDLRLSGDLKVTSIRRANKMLLITVVQVKDPAAGSITLGFIEEPFHLKKWRVVDSTNAITEIELFQMTTGLNLPTSLFRYVDPETGKRQNYNQ